MVIDLLPAMEIACGLALIALTLPLVCELALAAIGNGLPRRLSRHKAPLAGPLTVLVPAHNEETMIARTVRSLLAAAATDAAHPNQVCVIAHNCSDDTAANARAAGAMTLEFDSAPGKGYALRHGIAQMHGAAIAVVDADSTVAPNFFSAMRGALAFTPAAQCRYELDMPADSTRGARAQLMALAFRGMNVVRPRGRARLGFSCGIFGNGFALRADALQAVPWEAFGIAEDLEYHTRLELAGLRCRFVEETTVFGAPASGPASERSQRLRWEGGRLAVARQYAPRVLRRLLSGRFRSAQTLADLLSLPLAPAVALLVAALVVGGTARFAWLVGYSGTGLALAAVYVALAVRIAPEPKRACAALAASPGYVLRKLVMIPATLQASRHGTPWTRTQRTTGAPLQKEKSGYSEP